MAGDADSDFLADPLLLLKVRVLGVAEVEEEADFFDINSGISGENGCRSRGRLKVSLFDAINHPCL